MGRISLSFNGPLNVGDFILITTRVPLSSQGFHDREKASATVGRGAHYMGDDIEALLAAKLWFPASERRGNK